MRLWHHLSEDEVMHRLSSDRERGLSREEAKCRLEQYGENRLQEKKKEGILKRFLGQMRDPMILVLLAAAALSLISSGFTDWADPAIILLIVVLNAVISIAQENNADKALEALRNMSAPLAKVLRDGQMERLPTHELVP